MNGNVYSGGGRLGPGFSEFEEKEHCHSSQRQRGKRKKKNIVCEVMMAKDPLFPPIYIILSPFLRFFFLNTILICFDDNIEV